MTAAVALAIAGLATLGNAALAASGAATETVYLTESSNTIVQFNVGNHGVLGPARSSTTVAGAGVPYAIAVAAGGRYVYVAEDDYTKSVGSVAQYTVSAGGRLSPDPTPAVKAGLGPVAIAASHRGEVYVADEDAGTISQYRIGSGGMLKPAASPTIPAGTATDAIALAPGGRYAYVADQFAGPASQRSGAISQYTAGGGGMLTQDRTTTVTSGGRPFAMVVAPNGANVYVANYTATGGDGVSEYAVGSGGMLRATGSVTVKAGAVPLSIALSTITG